MYQSPVRWWNEPSVVEERPRRLVENDAAPVANDVGDLVRAVSARSLLVMIDSMLESAARLGEAQVQRRFKMRGHEFGHILPNR